MMTFPSINDENIVIDAYTPILFFHEDEQFFPMEPQTYIENSALWCAGASSSDHADWGGCRSTSEDDPVFPRSPLVERGTLSTDPTDDTEGEFGFFYLGHTEATGFRPYQVSNEQRELFLDFSGWDDPGNDFDPDNFPDAPTHTFAGITATTTNNEVDIEQAASLMSNTLASSEDWFHAEAFCISPGGDNLPPGLQPLANAVTNQFPGGLWVVLYHFFYAAHTGPVDECEAIADEFKNPEGPTPDHSNFGGDIQSVAVIIEAPSFGTTVIPPSALAPAQFPAPILVGYGRRQRGLAEQVAANLIEAFDLFTYDFGDVVAGGVLLTSNHPHAYVARGTHNNYPLPQPAPIPHFKPVDLVAFCTAVEAVSDFVVGAEETITDVEATASDVVVSVAKLAAGAAVGGAAAGPAGILPGVLGGALWAVIELISSVNEEGGSIPIPNDPGDFPPEEIGDGDDRTEIPISRALAPNGVVGHVTTLVGGIAPDVRPWRASAATARIDPTTQQWWPQSVGNQTGSDMRWGVKCENDHFARRSGIPYPDFRQAFQAALQQYLAAEQ